MTIPCRVIQVRTRRALTLATSSHSKSSFSGPRVVTSGRFARATMLVGRACVLGGVDTAVISSPRSCGLIQFLAGDTVERLAAKIRYCHCHCHCHCYRYRYRKALRFKLAQVACARSCVVATLISYLLGGSHALGGPSCGG